MRYLVTGGSRFDPAIARDFYSFGIDVLNAYGLTETTGGAFLNPPGRHRLWLGRKAFSRSRSQDHRSQAGRRRRTADR